MKSQLSLSTRNFMMTQTDQETVQINTTFLHWKGTMFFWIKLKQHKEKPNMLRQAIGEPLLHSQYFTDLILRITSFIRTIRFIKFSSCPSTETRLLRCRRSFTKAKSQPSIPCWYKTCRKSGRTECTEITQWVSLIKYDYLLFYFLNICLNWAARYTKIKLTIIIIL